MTWEIKRGDCLTVLRSMPDESVHCVISSPPYWGLRSYLPDGDPLKPLELGLEKTPEEYVAKMVEIFREVKRVLRSDGTCWLNLGDSYAGSRPNPGRNDTEEMYGAGSGPAKMASGLGQQPQCSVCGRFCRFIGGEWFCDHARKNYKPKDLCGIPWRVAFALQADGWWLRQDIVWSKPNPMPESVTDRCTKSHEYIFLLTKAPRYYCDMLAVAEPLTESSIERLSQPTLAEQKGSDRVPGKTNGPMKAVGTPRNDGDRWNENNGRGFITGGTRNKRSVWEITTQGYPEAHFATFPPKLVEPCILAGTSEKGCCAKCGAPWERIIERDVRFEGGSGKALTGGGCKAWRGERTVPGELRLKSGKHNGSEQAESGDYDIRMGPVTETKTLGWQPTCKHSTEVIPCTVLDPFSGAGTTGLVATRLGRSYIGIELKEEYAVMSENRITNDAPLFNTQEAGL